jgi:lipopolysaccharide transport system ATP-binding protein
MPQTIISVEDLSKRYLVGHESAQRERYTALRDVIAREARNFARKAADVLHGRQIVQGDEIEEFWALKNVNFEIKRGEVVGIIGRNGAGKSTLLKILSRITEPTEGRVTINGRVASLLEVGTGFHPELTGRENIYLNGAILGMTRAEIRRKFDEIVAFAEVEKFLDTPVKRYSSGMYVRLAFAVAAHLEPEILVVDEVLAVGDATFQKKCLGKIQEVAGQGRTVLFVSHNMAAVQALCGRGFLLQGGCLSVDGDIARVVSAYSEVGAPRHDASNLTLARRSGQQNIRFKSVEFIDCSGRKIRSPSTGQCLVVKIVFEGKIKDRMSSRIGISFQNSLGVILFNCASEAAHKDPLEVGSGTAVYCRIPRFPLTAGVYGIGLFLERNGYIEDWIQEPLGFEVEDSSFFGTARNVPNGWEGVKVVLVPNEWSYEFPQTRTVEAISA